jgi:hypothetical protein
MRGALLIRTIRSLIGTGSFLALSLLFLAPISAADDDTDKFMESIQSAVSGRRTERTSALGFMAEKPNFNDSLPQGGVLVGFECGVGNFGNIETVYALRPIFRTARGVSGGQEHGLFSDQRDGKRVIKSQVKRTVRVQASPGYAVGGITIRSGLNINGLSLTYHRIKGDRLDPFDSRESAWIGDRTGGSENSISTEGRPVVGIFGRQDNTHVQAVGLIHINLPAATKPAEQPKVEKPVEKPTEPKVVKPADPKVEKAAEAAADPAKAAEAVPAAPADADAAVAANEAAAGMNWLPLAIFGLVAVPIFLFMLVYARRQTASKMAAVPQHANGTTGGAPAMFEKPPSDALQPWPSGGEPRSQWPAADAPPSRPVASDAISTSPAPATPVGYQGLGSTYGSDALPPARADWDDPYGDPSRPRRSWGKRDGLYGGGETREMAAARKEVAGILFAIAGLQLVCGFALVAVIPEEMLQQGVTKNMLSWIVMIIGCAFGGLGYWGLSQPLPASIAGLVLYVVIFLLDLMMMGKAAQGGGGMPIQAIFIRIAIIAALVRAVSSAAKASASRSN